MVNVVKVVNTIKLLQQDLRTDINLEVEKETLYYSVDDKKKK